MMELCLLCFLFFLTGLFAIGGGLAAIPIMQQLIVDRGLVFPERFYNMIAISESTPGPIGVNMATAVGFENFGVFGGLLTTLSLVLPSFVIILIVAKIFSNMQNNPIVKNALYGIRASVSGLIASAAYSVLSVTILTPAKFVAAPSIFTLFDIKQLLIFAVILTLYTVFKKHPIWYILFGAVCGIVFM